MTTVAEYHRDVKARLTLSNGNLLEFSEYVQQIEDRIEVVRYSFHWTEADGTLVRRWDNAPHHPHLPQAPHHIHDGEQNKVRPGTPIHIAQVLDEIAAHLAQ